MVYANFYDDKSVSNFAYIHFVVCVSAGFQICANENIGVVTRNHNPYGGEPPLLIFLEITTETSQYLSISFNKGLHHFG